MAMVVLYRIFVNDDPDAPPVRRVSLSRVSSLLFPRGAARHETAEAVEPASARD
jgi:hypothetical protein